MQDWQQSVSPFTLGETDCLEWKQQLVFHQDRIASGNPIIDVFMAGCTYSRASKVSQSSSFALAEIKYETCSITVPDDSDLNSGRSGLARLSLRSSLCACIVRNRTLQFSYAERGSDTRAPDAAPSIFPTSDYPPSNDGEMYCCDGAI